jgi:polyphosphate kinase 2 (PPK2 family)
MTALPERGSIGIFNRSCYEERLVVRVHPEILARRCRRGRKPRVTQSKGRSKVAIGEKTGTRP